MFVELLRLACWSRRRGLRVDRIVDARVELGRREPLGEEVGGHVGVVGDGVAARLGDEEVVDDGEEDGAVAVALDGAAPSARASW